MGPVGQGPGKLLGLGWRKYRDRLNNSHLSKEKDNYTQDW